MSIESSNAQSNCYSLNTLKFRMLLCYGLNMDSGHVPGSMLITGVAPHQGMRKQANYNKQSSFHFLFSFLSFSFQVDSGFFTDSFIKSSDGSSNLRESSEIAVFIAEQKFNFCRKHAKERLP